MAQPLSTTVVQSQSQLSPSGQFSTTHKHSIQHLPLKKRPLSNDFLNENEQVSGNDSKPFAAASTVDVSDPVQGLVNRQLLSTDSTSTQLDYSNDFQQTFKESHHENARIPGVNSESESFLNQFHAFMADPVQSIFSPFRQIDPNFFNQNLRTTDDNAKSTDFHLENSHFFFF